MYKIAIIYVFLAVALFGQDTLITCYYEELEWAVQDYESALLITYHSNPDSVIIHSEFTAINLLNLLNKYWADCYNDSSEVTYWKFIETCRGNYGIVSGYDQLVAEWVHRQPTFQDFKEWLEKKVGE